MTFHTCYSVAVKSQHVATLGQTGTKIFFSILAYLNKFPVSMKAWERKDGVFKSSVKKDKAEKEFKWNGHMSFSPMQT